MADVRGLSGPPERRLPGAHGPGVHRPDQGARRAFPIDDVPAGAPDDVPAEAPACVPAGTPQDAPAGTPQDVPAGTLARTLREERPRIVAALIRGTGDWELAEDCAQDAAERALRTWPRDGVPDSPGAWLMTVARRRAVDVLRRSGRETGALARLAAQPAPPQEAPEPPGPGAQLDDRLQLLLACTHPALSLQDQVALTLKAVSGLSLREIADLLLVPEGTLGKRLQRARERIRREGLRLEVPPPERFPERAAAVLGVVYLVFTHGYAASGEDGPREAPAREAIELSRLVAALLPDHGEAQALRALLLLQHARAPARFDAHGDLVPLDEQDRGRWDRALLAEGMQALAAARAAVAADGEVGPYRAQAEIAARHSGAATAREVDWAGIVRWYDALLEATGSPAVAVNRAVAIGHLDGPRAGLAALAAAREDPRARRVPETLAAEADLLRRAGDIPTAIAAYRRALAQLRGAAARRHLERRIAELEAGLSRPGASTRPRAPAAPATPPAPRGR